MDAREDDLKREIEKHNKKTCSVCLKCFKELGIYCGKLEDLKKELKWRSQARQEERERIKQLMLDQELDLRIRNVQTRWENLREKVFK